ncbi:hypothetical protein DPMN_060707 [Dreissena polymorpha]|uniref:Uncharacterized protein n=1 Tax=Dreissena polymorpha TaxID=45954 RepID=A0A9D4C5Q7_DREPO|nr:hypothetical protein DPMN_060647 [Dreissena polymorpha]KAH3717911.1 hypothetical protein DPMN_060707 [Dreissena polymorpha]
MLTNFKVMTPRVPLALTPTSEHGYPLQSNDPQSSHLPPSMVTHSKVMTPKVPPVLTPTSQHADLLQGHDPQS